MIAWRESSTPYEPRCWSTSFRRHSESSSEQSMLADRRASRSVACRTAAPSRVNRRLDWRCGGDGTPLRSANPLSAVRLTLLAVLPANVLMAHGRPARRAPRWRAEARCARDPRCAARRSRERSRSSRWHRPAERSPCWQRAPGARRGRDDRRGVTPMCRSTRSRSRARTPRRRASSARALSAVA